MPKLNPENQKRRESRKEPGTMLGEMGVTDMAGVQELFKELVSTVLEQGLEVNSTKSSATASMTTETRRRITAGMGTRKRR